MDRGTLVNVAPVSTDASSSWNLWPLWSPISTVIWKVPIPVLYACASLTARLYLNQPSPVWKLCVFVVLALGRFVVQSNSAR